jgi:transglutaminase-like putative cysteine protease
MIMALAWTGAVSPARFAAAADKPANPAVEERQQKQLVALLGRLYKIAGREIAKPGADPSDTTQKAAELGNDPERIFAFVRDEVRYEPYSGVLRGARGALLARGGNSYDKSLLLQAMLESSGIKARLVRGELPADQAAALVAQFLAAKTTGPLADTVTAAGGALDPKATDFLRAVAGETGLDAGALTRSVTADSERADAAIAEAWSIVDREAAPLRQRLESAGVTLGQAFETARQELAARAAHHVWVEVPDAKDPARWVAMDPSFAGAPTGTAHATGQPLTITDADEHLVTVKLVYRRTAENGQPEDKNLVDVPMPARRAGFQFPQLVINPADELPPASKLMAMKKEDLVRTMAALKKFQPALRVGGESYFGQVFDLKGNLFQVAADGRVAGASKMGAAAGGLFGGGALSGDTGPKDEGDGPGKFLELSVVIEIASPGRPAVRQKRVLMTAADLGGKHQKSPLLTWDFVVQPQPVGAKWVAYRSVRALLAAMAPMVLASAKGTMSRGDVDSVTTGRPEPYPGLLFTMAMMRERAVGRQLSEAGDVRALWDTPLVAIAERTFCMNPTAGHACGNARVDIVDNTLRYVPARAGAEQAAVQAALKQGVFDTAAEALALRESLNTPGAPDQATVYSPIDDIAKARAAGDPLGVHRLSAGAPPAELALAESDRAWIAAHERPGQVIVAPAKAGSAGEAPGWWSVDPTTGCVLGRHAGGRGEAMSEKAIVTNLVGFAVCMISPIWDAAAGNVKDTKSAVKVSLNVIGCVAGCAFGFGGGMARTAKGAENLALMWSIISGAFTVGDKMLG